MYTINATGNKVEAMSYLDHYPCCIGCPVEKYCGTMVSSVRLCHSYDDSMAEKEKSHALTLSEAAPEEEQMPDEDVELTKIDDPAI